MLLRNSAAAIVAYFVYTFILPVVGEALGALIDGFDKVVPWIEFNTAQMPLFTGDYRATRRGVGPDRGVRHDLAADPAGLRPVAAGQGRGEVAPPSSPGVPGHDTPPWAARSREAHGGRVSRYLRVAALGDSTTFGIGDPVPGGWRGWARLLVAGLRASYDVSLCVTAEAGATTSQVRERQLADAVAHRPDVATLVVGVNDMLRSTWDPQRTRNDLLACADALTASGALLLTIRYHDHPALMGLPSALQRPLSARLDAVNRAYDEVHADVRRAAARPGAPGPRSTTAAAGRSTGCTPPSWATGPWRVPTPTCSPSTGTTSSRPPRSARAACPAPGGATCAGWSPRAGPGWGGGPATSAPGRPTSPGHEARRGAVR